MRTSYGPPDVVRIFEVDKPVARDNQVLVKVHAMTVNRTDCGFWAGTPFLVRLFTGLRGPRVTILGNEFAGEVAAVGSGVRAFAVGERVFGYSGLQHGSRFGARLNTWRCRRTGRLRHAGEPDLRGGRCQYRGSHDARSLISKSKIRSGQDVLVNGATGASARRRSSC